MKKTLAKTLIIAIAALALLLSGCGEAAEAPAPAPTEFDSLLIGALWQSEDGSELEFAPDLSGRLGDLRFTWRSDGKRVTLSFFPGCLVEDELELTAALSGAALTLRAGDECYKMSSGGDDRAADAEASAQELSAEEQLGREIADFALNFLGSDYTYGGKTPEEGFDCSGLVYYVYGQFGYSVARVANDQAKQGEEVAPEDLRAGDVLAFYKGKDYVGHVGIYMGGGYYLHAMGEAYGVVLTSLDDPYLQRVYTARRYIGCDELLSSVQQGA